MERPRCSSRLQIQNGRFARCARRASSARLILLEEYFTFKVMHSYLAPRLLELPVFGVNKAMGQG